MKSLPLKQVDDSSKVKTLPPNLKEQNACYSCRISIRDREQFYKIVKWLNNNVGMGEDKWTMEGHVLKKLKQGNAVNTKIYIFIKEFDDSSFLYLNLL